MTRSTSDSMSCRRDARTTPAAIALHVTTAVGAGLLLLLAACSGNGAKPSMDSASAVTSATGADASSMGSMEGMKATDAGTVILTAAQVQHGNVRWTPASVGSATAVVTVPGQLVANEDRTARLGAPARGRILSVRVNPGDRVTRGQLLVTLESPEAGTAQSDLAKAEAELAARRAQAKYAELARERAARLLALKAIPQQDYERAVADDEAAKAALAQADAERRRARSTAGQLGADAAGSGQMAIRAPLAGVVLTRTAVPGAVVEAGAPLVVITDPASLWLVVDAPEKFAALFHRGAPLRFTVPAYGMQQFLARTEAIGAGLDPESRTLPVRGVASSDGRLKAEMLATVSVEGAGAPVPAVVVPDGAVQMLDGRTVVFVATPEGRGGTRFVARPVEVASRANGSVVITNGVKAGDLVVIDGAFAVKAQITKGNMPDMEM